VVFVNHKSSHSLGGLCYGKLPNSSRAPIYCGWPAWRPEVRPKTGGGGKYPPRQWAEPGLGSGAAVEGLQDGVGDGGGAVAAAEFARREARGKRAVDGAFDGARGASGSLVAMPFG
jgi:hypothetical protein